MEGKQCILSQMSRFRALTVLHSICFTMRSKQMAWRHLRRLESEGKIYSIDGAPNGSGRPERIWCASEHKNVAPALIQHTLLVNWVAALGASYCRENADYSMDFLPEWGEVDISTSFELPDSSRRVKVKPDAVMVLRSKRQRKALLYFIEADCGTEPLQSQDAERGTITEKIEHYRLLLGLKHYEYFSSRFNYPFNGFRVLFVANTEARALQIHRLTQRLFPADFIWVTHESLFREQGFTGNCWLRGGDTGLHSIIHI